MVGGLIRSYRRTDTVTYSGHYVNDSESSREAHARIFKIW